MCLIVFKPEGIDLPKEENLRNGAVRNSDGMGIALLKKDEKVIRIRKDFSRFFELSSFIKDNVSKEDILLIHFRWATSGLKDKGNCHPFPLSKNKDKLRALDLNCKYALAHNGIISQLGKSDTLSDTQEFIMKILHDPVIKENLDKPSVRELLEHYLSGDRLAIINNRREVWLMGDFSEDEEDKCFYSNKGYKTYCYRSTRNKDYASTYGAPYYLSHDKKGEENDTVIKKEPEKKILTNPLLNKDGVLFCECEGCAQRKHTKQFKFKDSEDVFYLCKKCRKKAKKGNLILEKDKGDEAEVWEKCASCSDYFPLKDMKILYNDYLVCKTCCKQIESNNRKEEQQKAEEEPKKEEVNLNESSKNN